MRNYSISYVTVGVFVTAMVVALVVAVALIGGRTGPRDSRSSRKVSAARLDMFLNTFSRISGGMYAMAAARALLKHTKLTAGEIARDALQIAADICIYTNSSITVEEI